MTPDEVLRQVAARDPRYARFLGPGRPPAPRPAAAAADCPHRGAPTGETVPCKSCRGTVQLKVLACAVHGSCTVGRKVDGHACCQGCPDRPRAPTPGGDSLAPVALDIPPPPPLALTPTGRRAVVVPLWGEEGARLLAASRGPLAAYARSLGADLVVLDDYAGTPAWPMSAKLGIGRALDHYDRVAFIDADVLPTPASPDVFALCAEHEMGVCDELPHHRAHPHFGLEASYHAFRAGMGLRPVPHLPWYFNAGVMVVPRSHRAVFAVPARLPVPPRGPGRHCAEQHLWNAQLFDSGLPYRLMDRRANWQNWTDHGFAAAPPDALRHWSGAGGERVHRADQMAALAAAAPWPVPPEARPA